MSKCLQHGDGEGLALVELTDPLNMTKSHMTFKRVFLVHEEELKDGEGELGKLFEK